MSGPRSDLKPLIVKAIRIEEGTDTFFKRKGLNMSLVCRDLLYEFMNLKNINPKYYFERVQRQQKKSLRKYEN